METFRSTGPLKQKLRIPICKKPSLFRVKIPTCTQTAERFISVPLCPGQFKLAWISLFVQFNNQLDV